MEECLRADVRAGGLHLERSSRRARRHGKTADEGQLFTAGPLAIPYVDSVHEAELEALRLAARGLPLVCVNPGACFGPGDYLLSSTRLVRTFLLGRVPVYVDGAASIVDVRDVAAGHLLADERGGNGERYILGGAQLHLRPSLRRPGPAVGGRAAGQGSGCRRRVSRWRSSVGDRALGR